MALTPVAESNLITAADTHPGESGKNNEDNYAVCFFKADDGAPVTLAVVADGVGGNRAGEVASALAVRSVIVQVQLSNNAGDYQEIFQQAMEYAAQTIAEQVRTNFDYAGMSTTCAVALVWGYRLYIGYLGDSRIYFLRDGVMRQISVDHTWLQAALEHNLISREEAPYHPNQHVLLRYLGAKVNAKPDLRVMLKDSLTQDEAESNQGMRLLPGDTVLLCSDGLSDLVEAVELADVITHKAPTQAVQELINMARERGGHDNITVVLLHLPEK